MNKSSESYKVYLDKTESAKMGVTAQQEVGGQSYPGRPTPPVQTVKDAVVEKGAAIRCSRKQTGENRYPLNQHVADRHEHGPNN